MSLTDLASIGSFVSGLAVLISLIYLALQVRQAERNQRAILQQGRAARAVDTLLRIGESETIEAYTRGSDGDESTTQKEFRQFYMIFQASLTGFEDTYFQHRDGMLAAGAFESTAATFKVSLGRPGNRAMYRLVGMHRDSGFRQVLDRLASEATREVSADGFATWKRLVAEEKATPSAE
jgi:hypothetical protein